MTRLFSPQVVLDESGFSKGYGFVRFGNEQEQQHALGCMTGEMGLGSKPIKVSSLLGLNVEIINIIIRSPWLIRRTELRMEVGACLPRLEG